MSKPQNEYTTKGKRTSNISLPDRPRKLDTLGAVSRRNTITEGTTSKVRKKAKPPSTPTIPEDGPTGQNSEKTIAFSVENESKKLSRKSSDASRISASSASKSKVTNSYENKAYEGSLKRSESANESVRTASSRPPSVQSLEIYHEQYCCFARRTKCERSLLITVTVLAIIVVVLIAVIIVLAKNNKLGVLFNIHT